MRVIYLLSWYEEKDERRREELTTCLQNVINHPQIDLVHVFTNCELPVKSEKLVVEYMEGRIRYRDMFSVGNHISKDGDIVIIANTDLYPSEGAIEKIKGITDSQCYALSRWDIMSSRSSKHYVRKDSQDVWIFRSPIKEIPGFYGIGVPGCDNRIAQEIKEQGYQILNPSKDVIFHHLHLSKVRNYKSGIDTVPGPYHFVEPCTLSSLNTTQTVTSSVTKKSMKILHVGFDQAPLEKVFAKIATKYKFIKWTDYQGKVPELRKLMIASQQADQYNLVFMHVQTANIVDPGTIITMRSLCPNTQFVNWSGDVRFPQQKWYAELGKHVDLTCFSNETDVERIKRLGVKSQYLQIGFDNEIFIAGEPKKTWPEIVFLGNNYNTQFPLSVARTEMVKLLATKYGEKFGVYGGNWSSLAAGNLMNDIQGEADCYRGCKIAINFSHFNYERYSSDRIFRIMGSGAFCLSHYYPGLEKDFRPGWELDTWVDTDELCEKIDYYLGQDKLRKDIAITGCNLVHSKHTWESRIKELLKILAI